MPTYLSVDVFDQKPNRPGRITEGIARRHEVLDTETGKRWLDVKEAAPVADRPEHWPCLGRAAALAQRAWLDVRKGFVVPFWAPTFEPDLELTADIDASATEITVERIDYSARIFPNSNRRRHIVVYARGEAPSYHYISAAVDDGEVETLTITPATPVAWPRSTTVISFLRYCRLGDAFIERRWIGGAYCEAEIPIVEIPKETPAP